MSGMTVHFNFVASSNYIWAKYFILRVLLNLFKDLVLCVHEITHYFLAFRNSNCGKSYKFQCFLDQPCLGHELNGSNPKISHLVDFQCLLFHITNSAWTRGPYSCFEGLYRGATTECDTPAEELWGTRWQRSLYHQLNIITQPSKQEYKAVKWGCFHGIEQSDLNKPGDRTLLCSV